MKRGPYHLKDSPWTKEAIEGLTRLWSDGYSASQISEVLGDISRCAVIGKAHRLGLESRPRGVNPLRREAVLCKPAAKTVPPTSSLPRVGRSRRPLSATTQVIAPQRGWKTTARPPEKTKSQLRAELAQAVRNTAAMPVE